MPAQKVNICLLLDFRLLAFFTARSNLGETQFLALLSHILEVPVSSPIQ